MADKHTRRHGFLRRLQGFIVEVLGAEGCVRTNLLFFTKGQPTERVWYYDVLDINVGKESPLARAHFEGFFRLLPQRAESERSWTVTRAQIGAKGYDLNAVNPDAEREQDTRTPEKLLDLIEAKSREIAAAIAMLRQR